MSKIELLNCDCLEFMRTLPDKAFDLAIVDPPYGIGVNSMNMGGRKTVRPDERKWDDETPDESYFTELKRVSRNQIIWGGNYFTLTPSRCWLIWDKGETLYGRDFAEAEMAWTSLDAVVRMFKMGPNQKDRIHPTQKPVALYRWLLQNYAKPGDRILDTHGGSMSIAIACDIEGFDLTLCELDKDYFEAGKKRVAAHQAQPRIFDPPKVEPEQLKIL